MSDDGMTVKPVATPAPLQAAAAAAQPHAKPKQPPVEDLIRQIPNEEVLRLAELAHDETIVLVNEKA